MTTNWGSVAMQVAYESFSEGPARAVLAAIALHADRVGVASLADWRVSEQSGVPAEVVDRALLRLAEDEELIVVPRDGRQLALYGLPRYVRLSDVLWDIADEAAVVKKAGKDSSRRLDLLRAMARLITERQDDIAWSRAPSP